MAIQQELEASVRELVKDLENDELEVELGRRLKINEDELQTQTVLSAATAMSPELDSAQLAGPRDFFRNLAKSFLDRFNRQLYDLVCNPDDPDNSKVTDAVSGGAEKVALVVAGVLSANFAWLPAIVAVVAALVAKRAVKAGHEAVCDAWQKEIDQK